MTNTGRRDSHAMSAALALTAAADRLRQKGVDSGAQIAALEQQVAALIQAIAAGAEGRRT